MGESEGMPAEMKQAFLTRIADLLMQDVLSGSDLLAILEICERACKRELGEPERTVQ